MSASEQLNEYHVILDEFYDDFGQELSSSRPMQNSDLSLITNIMRKGFETEYIWFFYELDNLKIVYCLSFQHV